MRKPVIIFMALIAALLILSAGCTRQEQSDNNTATPPPAAKLLLTLEELAAYNGKNGNPAYVAVDGVIYDVTNLPAWKNGEHNGYQAGQDLTDIIKNKSPHGISKLSKVPIVGSVAK